MTFSSLRYSTTGLIAVNFALHLCQEVNIAGFGYPPRHDKTAPVHYYGLTHLTDDVVTSVALFALTVN
uniref:Uncharacterized protein n=1 Tax=Sphaerodactylus townsendi TaxID=933632 RepID=A0ACB8F0B0_9SAUR